ncbi:MAG: hypothetical protein ACI8PZ_006823 [Myxococcota bacterium]|jgi:hypothetical protein
MAITRRAMLAITGAGLAGSVAVLVPLRGPEDGMRVLSHEERLTVAAAALTWFPGDPFPIRGDDPAVVDEIDRIVADVLSGPQQVAFRYIVRTLQLGTIATEWRTFAALQPADRVRVLSTWGDPDVMARRVALDSLKAVVGMAYFKQPDVLAHIGVRRTCGAPVGRARSQADEPPIAPQPAGPQHAIHARQG